MSGDGGRHKRSDRIAPSCGGGNGHIVKNCLSTSNGGTGILIDASGLVRGVVENCVATENGGDGIRANNSVIRGCLSALNTGTNITGGGNLVIDSLP
ncbi:MAG: hypothetical protein ACF8QF_11845 [Phycisphaerales bacterium]